MKLFRRAALGLLALVVLGASGVAAFMFGARPLVRPAARETVVPSPELLARGTYLVEHLLPCISCHSRGDMSRFGQPASPEHTLTGGLVFDRKIGLPGTVQPPNLTPDAETGIGRFTDGELIRAMREGIGRDGRALFPMMPYGELKGLSDEDAKAVVVYLRSLAPRKSATLPTQVDFPVSMFIRLGPVPVEGPVSAPDPKDHRAYGKYLVTMAGCPVCHTERVRGKVVGGELGGGNVFKLPVEGGTFHVVTPNLTSDPTGYTGRASVETFIARIRGGAALATNTQRIAPESNTLMPWIEYSGLTDADLTAIYDYIKSVEPVKNTVVVWPLAGKKT